MTLKKLVLITAGAMLLSGTAMAKNINVPGDFAKIADALGNADAGDTILVKRGVYNENITLIMGVVLKGEDPLSTIIDGGRRGPTVMGTSGAEMSHFTVRNGLEGILCENAAPYIHHCYVIDNHATGIGAFISLPWLRNNVVYGNRWSGILAWGAKSLDAYIEQNVVLRNGYSGLTLKGPTNLVARNNIFMENHYYGVFADPAAGQTKVEYNNIYKNYYPFNQFIKVNRTNVSLDPKFISPSLGNPNSWILVLLQLTSLRKKKLSKKHVIRIPMAMAFAIRGFLKKVSPKSTLAFAPVSITARKKPKTSMASRTTMAARMPTTTAMVSATRGLKLRVCFPSTLTSVRVWTSARNRLNLSTTTRTTMVARMKFRSRRRRSSFLKV